MIDYSTLRSNGNPISRVYNMDCMDFLRATPDKFFELSVCDPPYGINHSVKAGKMAGQQYGNAAAKKKDYAVKEWDAQIPNAEYFEELKRVSKNQVIWGGNYMIEHLLPKSGWIFWDKDNGSNNFSDGELAWTSFDKGLRKFKYTWNGMIQGNMANKQERIHPTEKPYQLYQWVLQNYAKQGDKILDTHMGSQSSRIAAYKMNFDYYGCELDSQYFKEGCERFDKAISEPLFDKPKELIQSTLL